LSNTLPIAKAQLIKEREEESRALQEAWTRKQDEMVVRTPDGAPKRNESLSRRNFEKRKAVSRSGARLWKKNISVGTSGCPKPLPVPNRALRQELLKKKKVLRRQYQSQLNEAIGGNNQLLEEHRKNLATQF